MESNQEIIKKIKPLDIVVFHVGGIGNYGPVDELMKHFPEHVVAVCFEANPSKDDLLVQKKYSEHGVKTMFVPKCVSDKSGKQDFYVNKHPESSSLFPPSPKAIGNHVKYKNLHTWGQTCELDHMEKVDVVTFDELVENKTLPKPDFFSIDAQGAELLIIKGGQRSLEDVMCVITEVEFFEVYQGQDMFCDHQKFLAEHGFRLAEIMNTQYWHPGPAAGRGFAVASEALYLRDLETYSTKFQNQDSKKLLYKLLKLAIISYAFGRRSYSSKIVGLAIEKFGSEAEDLLSSDKSLKKILDLQRYMQKNNSNYLKDNLFFYKKEMINRNLRNLLRPIGRPIKKLFIKYPF